MANKVTATRPDFFANFESLRRNEKAKQTKTTPEEQAYYAMSMSEGWKLFNIDKDRLLEEMDNLIDRSITNGLTREQIGENTIVVSLAKGIIKRLINKVEDAKKACEQSPK